MAAKKERRQSKLKWTNAEIATANLVNCRNDELDAMEKHIHRHISSIPLNERANDKWLPKFSEKLFKIAHMKEIRLRNGINLAQKGNNPNKKHAKLAKLLEAEKLNPGRLIKDALPENASVFQSQIQQRGKDLLQRYLDLAFQQNDLNVAERATKWLLERGYGKAPQTVEHKHQVGSSLAEILEEVARKEIKKRDDNMIEVNPVEEIPQIDMEPVPLRAKEAEKDFTSGRKKEWDFFNPLDEG